MVPWRSAKHLEDHYEIHRREIPGYSIAQYDASAQETVDLGTRFTYRDQVTREPRVGYFHRASSRFVAVDDTGYVHTLPDG